jgi:hypothetical protein
MTTTPRATPRAAVNEALLHQMAAEIREEIPEAQLRCGPDDHCQRRLPT